MMRIMNVNRLHLAIIIAIVLVVFSLAFSVIGIMTPSENFDEMSGFGKVFAASAEFDFESGSFVTSFGDFSFSINFGLNKPFLSLLSESNVVHINIVPFVLILFAMVVSCIIPEVSFITSGFMAVLVGITMGRLIPILREQIANGATPWDAAAGSFWFVVFLLAVVLANGVLGIGAKLIDAIVMTETAKIVGSIVVSLLLANAVSLIICLLGYVTVGLGWCGGLMLWFIVMLLLVAFCEIMNVISF